ncbi:DinB family protein [Chloroflexi bacterium TSY]|nr:DinB family protein [Chloroflexi bacterium TSY]
MSKDRLARHFGITYWIMEKQTEGLTHDDSVLQPALRGNCMNWVLGHILDSREKVLNLLDQEPLMTDEERARYTRGSEPVINSEDCVHFDRLMSILHESQKQILGKLETLTDDDLAQIVDEERKESLGARLSFLHWHETYHAGQFEYLRQLAGTNDSIIP